MGLYATEGNGTGFCAEPSETNQNPAIVLSTAPEPSVMTPSSVFPQPPALLGGSNTAGILLIQKLQTGNQFFDVIIAIIVPILISTLARGIPKIVSYFSNVWQNRSTSVDEYTRAIISKKTTNYNGQISITDDRNDMLMLAVLLSVARTMSCFQAEEDNMPSSSEQDQGKKTEAESIAKKAVSLEELRKFYRGSVELMMLDPSQEGMKVDRYGSLIANDKALTAFEQVKRYRLVALPPMDNWIELGDGLKILRSQNKNKANDDKAGGAKGKSGGAKNSADSKMKYCRTTEHVLTLSARGENARDRVEGFITKAYNNYLAELAENDAKDEGRYMYVLTAERNESEYTGGDNGCNDDDYYGDEQETTALSSFVYKKYPLAETKTFKNLWFPEKESLQSLLTSFMEKSGKFSRPGFPDKLGVLLYGPPGTGKTSLIKAMAHFTKRHIVSISLSKIKTNEELLEVMFDLRFDSQGNNGFTKDFNFKDLIFVIEDIDCASTIVMKREQNAHHENRLKAVPEIEDENADCKDTDDGAGETKNLSDSPTSTAPSSPASASGLSLSLKNIEEPQQESITAKKQAEESEQPQHLTAADLQNALRSAIVGAMGMSSSSKRKNSNRLNLSGLLNVLDGVIDSPGRILIMTTNHPEKLDPALIRPGRVNKRLCLDYMAAQCALEMIQHFHPDHILTIKEKEDILRLLGEDSNEMQLSPATMEQICVESDEVSDVIDRLQAIRKSQHRR